MEKDERSHPCLPGNLAELGFKAQCQLPKIRWWRPSNSLWCCPRCSEIWILRRDREYGGYGDSFIYERWERLEWPTQS
jgi:hypothetical protein